MKNTKLLTLIGIMTSLAFVLYLIEIPVGFLFPSAAFLKIDFSDLPAILMSMAYGPLSGVLVELFKNILHLLFKSETPAASGEIANFFAGVAYFLPLSLYIRWSRKKGSFKLNPRMSALYLALGTIALTLVMMVINYFITLPLYGIPTEQRWTFINAITPFNLFKGSLLLVITLMLYPRLSKFLSD